MALERPAGDAHDLPVLTRAALSARIEAYLQGPQGQPAASALAAWAFEQFYAADMDALLLEAGAEEEIEEVLDTLMFADDTAFALDTAALTALLQRLTP